MFPTSGNLPPPLDLLGKLLPGGGQDAQLPFQVLRPYSVSLAAKNLVTIGTVYALRALGGMVTCQPRAFPLVPLLK